MTAPTNSPPRRRFHLDPRLSDGQHWTVAEPAQALAMLLAWMESAELGDSVAVKFVEISDAEFEGLKTV